MATDQQVLAAEAKVRDARMKAASTAAIKGTSKHFMDGLVGLMSQFQAFQAEAEAGDLQAKADLAALQDVSALDAYGAYSSVDQLLRLERFAGKGAAVDFIKAHPECTEAEAEGAWEVAALAATALPALIVPVASYSALYRVNLVKAGLTTAATWEAQRAWIVATDKATIMGA